MWLGHCIPGYGHLPNGLSDIVTRVLGGLATGSLPALTLASPWRPKPQSGPNLCARAPYALAGPLLTLSYDLTLEGISRDPLP